MRLNRLTKIFCSFVGMIFLGTGLLVGLWAGADVSVIIENTFFSGLIGAGLGFAAGKLITLLMAEWIKKPSVQKKEVVNEKGAEVKDRETKQELQPWTPPRIDRDNNHGG